MSVSMSIHSGNLYSDGGLSQVADVQRSVRWRMGTFCLSQLIKVTLPTTSDRYIQPRYEFSPNELKMVRRPVRMGNNDILASRRKRIETLTSNIEKVRAGTMIVEKVNQALRHSRVHGTMDKKMRACHTREPVTVSQV